MDKLDDIVIREVLKRVLHADRLHRLLEAYVSSANDRSDQHRNRLAGLRQELKEAEASITRLLMLVENGAMDADVPSMRERLVGLRLRRDELSSDISDLQRYVSNGEPAISKEKVELLGAMLRDKLHNGAPELRQAYARLLMTEVSVKEKEIRITGSKLALARAATRGLTTTPPAVLSFVREWRAVPGEDDNYVYAIALL